MYKFDDQTGTVIATNGGYSQGPMIRDTFVDLGRGMQHLSGMLYEPVVRVARSCVAVVSIHSDDDYTTRNIGAELARRGFLSYCGKVENQRAPLDHKLLDVDRVVRFLKAVPGVEKVVLMGHSGGATLMTAYQRAAENGIGSLKKEDLLYKSDLPDTTELMPADGLMLLDANYGNGAMTLISVEPGIREEGNQMDLDPAFDQYDPANGYDPAGAHYPETFRKKFFRAQAERNNRLIDTALDALSRMEAGKGNYSDDEPWPIAGSNQPKPFNKLINQDLSLLAHSKKEHDLIHGDGTITHEIVYCERDPFSAKQVIHNIFGASQGTLREYLASRAVRALANYEITEDDVIGVDWDHSFDCGPGNAPYIHCPLLAVGMAGSYEYLAAEMIYDRAASEDKTCAFVRGADHNFDPNTRTEKYPGEYGDTESALYDYAGRWMDERFV